MWLVTNNKEGRSLYGCFLELRYVSIPIVVTKDGTKELNMCVVLHYCNSSYNNNQ